MVERVKRLSTLLLLVAAGSAFALPRPNSKVVAGANHHLGDKSFEVAHDGARPSSPLQERDRMHLHLSYVRDWLAARPATKPELAKKRAEILAHFDAYIAKYTTPKNEHVPWRTPVFIDDEGTICAVGYLIEQTAGRKLPETIAKDHRYDFIEDIANDMPEVATWVEQSGFTLDEIAHIQPAYSEPSANTWRTWNLAKHKPADGAYDKLNSRGVFKKGKMEGTWVAYSSIEESEVIVGTGEMKHGTGTWTSFYDDGKTKLGTGLYVNNRAQGAWKMFHKSGNLAAEGSFASGNRAGLWSFYYDTAKKTPIAIGRFDAGGIVAGRWRHFDEAGALVATTWAETPDQWTDANWSVDGGEGFMLDVVPVKGGVKHVSHQGTVHSASQQFDMYAFGGETMFVHAAFGHDTMYDADGYKLERNDEGGWSASDCHWSAKRKKYAHAGDLVPLHGVLYNEVHRRLGVVDSDEVGGGGGGEDTTGPRCGKASTVGAKRTAKLDRMLASRDEVRAVTPQFVRAAVLGEEQALAADAADADKDAEEPEACDADDYDCNRQAEAKDLPRVLHETMSMYIEWPHIDGRFEQLYNAMAGRTTWHWTDGDPESRED